VLYASLWRTGLAVQPTSVAAGDGQRLVGTRMAAAVRCAPPQNKPSVVERDTCAPWLTAEFRFVAESLRAVVCLGHFAWQAIWPQLAAVGFGVPRPRPTFGHGVEVLLQPAGHKDGHTDGKDDGRVASGGRGVGESGDSVLVIGCYHPSQQNTFTGRVTDVMLDEVFGRASRHSGL
jgi:uracil-DNA glycosylase